MSTEANSTAKISFDRGRSRKRTTAMVALLGALIVALGVAVWLVAWPRHGLGYWDQCLGTIGFALRIYAHDHQGAYPTNLFELYPKYVSPMEPFDPCNRRESKRLLSLGYAYVRGLRANDPSDCPVLIQLPRSSSAHSLVVFHDGHCEIHDYAYVTNVLADPTRNCAVLKVSPYDGRPTAIDNIRRQAAARRAEVVYPTTEDLRQRLREIGRSP